METFADERPSNEPPHGAGATPPENPEVAESAGGIREDLRLLTRELGVFAGIQVDRARLAVQSAAQQIIAGLVILVVVTVFLACSALRLLDGVRGAVLAASDSPWIADLAAGVLGCTVVIGFVWLRTRSASRRSREEVARKYPVDAPSSTPA